MNNNELKSKVVSQINQMTDEEKYQPFVVNKNGDVIQVTEVFYVSGYMLTCTPGLIADDFIKWIKDNGEK